MKSLRKEKGFTLIELLVVVAIIGVLATIVLSSLGTARIRAKDAKIKTTLSQARTQAELQYIETGDYSTICNIGTKSYDMFEDAHSNGGPGTGSNLCADEDNVPNAPSGNSLVNNTTSSQWFDPDSNGSSWAMTVKLNSGIEWFCVDSLGGSKTTSGPNRPLQGGEKTCI